jgi:hypothetical protein
VSSNERAVNHDAKETPGMKRMRALAISLAIASTATLASAKQPDEEIQAPRAQEIQAPRADEVQAPRGQEIQAPRG